MNDMQEKTTIPTLIAKARAWDAMNDALESNAGKTDYTISAADVCAVGFSQQLKIARGPDPALSAVDLLTAELDESELTAVVGALMWRLDICHCEDGHICNRCFSKAEDLIGLPVRDSLNRVWVVEDVNTESEQLRVSGAEYWDTFENVTACTGAIDDAGAISHDGNTCPIHEETGA